MGFTTDNRTIFDIFQRASRYVIPRYQRGYVWEKKNWKDLRTDISFILDSDNVNWSHFLGTIVLSSITVNNHIESIKGITDYEIIDGQQRITTLYVLLIAIAQKLKELGTDESKNRSIYIKDTLLTSKSTDNKPHMLLLNPELERDLMELLDLDAFASPVNNNNLREVYTYFYTEFDDSEFNDLDKFLNALLEINIVEITSSKEEEIYNIFEVLNARGQKLKQIELLKNHIMKYIQPREGKFIDKAKEDWNTIIKNTENLSNPDILINHFSKCYIKKHAINAESVYQLIKEEIELSKLATLLNDLVVFSDSYRTVTDSNTKDRNIEYFNIKRNQQIRSLLASIQVLADQKIIDGYEKNQSFQNIRNFFFIFNITKQTSNKMDKIVSDAAYNIYHSRTSLEFKYMVSDFFQSISKFIDKSLFYQNFESNETLMYSNKDKKLKKNGKIVKYTLISYLSFYQKDSNLDPNRLTIEHLVSDDGNTQNAKIGNLTLTTEDINSNELGNKSIIDKVNILSDQSSIKANQSLSNFLIDGSFNSKKRFDDILELLYNNIFNFNVALFNIDFTSIERFKKNMEIVRDHEDLCQLLLTTGNRFDIVLEQDPKLSDLKSKFISLSEIS